MRLVRGRLAAVSVRASFGAGMWVGLMIGLVLGAILGALLAWFAGFAAYQWLSPTGPSWWVDQVQRLDPPSWQIGATLPSFAVSFVLALAVAAARFTRIGMVRA